MSKTFARFGALFAIAMLCVAASAEDVPIGVFSYDVTGTNLAQFDIINVTGPNSSSPGDPSAPVTNPVTLADLSLTVYFSGGGSETFGSSYFTLRLSSYCLSVGVPLAEAACRGH